MRLKSRYVVFFVIVFLLILVRSVDVFAQTETPTPSPTVASGPSQDELQSKINEYQQKISELQGKGKTLSSQIAIMTNQAKLTELRIADTKEKIASIEKDIEITKDKVSNLENDISYSTKAMLGRVAAVYQFGRVDPWEVLLTSKDVSSLFTRLKYLRLVQAYDKKNIYAAEQAKVDYNNQKTIFEEKEKEAKQLSKKLEDYTAQLEQEKKSKQTLLNETRGSESNYQQLIAQAKAQLAAFSRFTQSQGGASLLGSQTSCDDWGCYYNQRDSSWGGLALNGTQYTLASDGCLVTAMAMVYTHYGHRGVTPLTINSNSGNFASYYPAWLKKIISANGTTSSRVGADMDSVLASGHPLIVGISYDGGSLADHFVVFTSGSNGNYTMHDPFTPNGRNISFREKYPGVRIVEIERVNL